MARPAGVAEGCEGAPAEGEDAGEGEVGESQAREERGVCALEGEAEGEERFEGVIGEGDDAEVLEAWERWERKCVSRVGYGSVLRHGDCKVLALRGGSAEG